MIFANNPTRISLHVNSSWPNLENWFWMSYIYVCAFFFFQTLRIDFECPTSMFLPFFLSGWYVHRWGFGQLRHRMYILDLAARPKAGMPLDLRNHQNLRRTTSAISRMASLGRSSPFSPPRMASGRSLMRYAGDWTGSSDPGGRGRFWLCFLVQDLQPAAPLARASSVYILIWKNGRNIHVGHSKSILKI